MIVVIGDLLLDRELRGAVKRLAPDAPVPVLSDVRESLRPGGAGLAALILREMDEEVTLIAAVAGDQEGHELKRLLERHGIRLIALESGDCTRVKERLSTDEQILMRVDRGGEKCAPRTIPIDLIDVISQADAILVSDYGGGVTREPLIRALVANVDIPVVWDPHPRGAEPVARVSLVTPNRSEAGVRSDAETRARELVSRWEAPVAITLGSHGAVVCLDGISARHIPAVPTVGDPCGAGDAFAATAVMGLAHGMSVEAAVIGAVEAASAWVARDKWSERSHIVVATGGCFDILHLGHVRTLELARSLGDRLVVLINSDRSVRALKGQERPINSQSDRAAVLSALSCVDEVIIFDELTPEAALREIKPDIWVKGGDYLEVDLPESRLLKQWGGRTVVAPYIEGYSTTGLAARSAG